MPPSRATSQYPVPDGTLEPPMIGACNAMLEASPYECAANCGITVPSAYVTSKPSPAGVEKPPVALRGNALATVEIVFAGAPDSDAISSTAVIQMFTTAFRPRDRSSRGRRSLAVMCHAQARP